MKQVQVRIEGGKVQVGTVDNSQQPIGKCAYCPEQVYAAPGQSVWYVTIIGKRFGEEVSRKQFPTHKACRKKHAKL